MKKSLVTTIVCCLATAVIGVFVGRMTAPAGEPEIIEVEKVVVAAPVDNKADAQIALLNKRIADYEDRIADLTAKPEPAPQVAAANTVPDDNADPAAQRRWGRMTDEELELLKTTDPERYAEEMRLREERETARNEWLENRRQSEELRDNFFAGLNMDRMNRDERAQLESFVADYQSLRSIMDNGGRNAEGEQVEPMQMMQLGMSVATRADEVRKSVLRSYGREIGFNRRESEQFADKINEVYDATSLLGPGGAGNITRMIGNRAGGGGGGFNLPIGGGNAGGGAGGFGAGRQRGGNRGGGN
ncbi:MAG: hypothetical protein FWG05_04335 [Kiritimatiellaeota bacterium]|nr:hypothetical protein [Kiritimatiellota bacterium]